jgi:hypothetical protein
MNDRVEIMLIYVSDGCKGTLKLILKIYLSNYNY